MTFLIESLIACAVFKIFVFLMSRMGSPYTAAYPSTTSNTIISAKPRANPTVPTLECLPWE